MTTCLPRLHAGLAVMTCRYPARADFNLRDFAAAVADLLDCLCEKFHSIADRLRGRAMR